MEEKIWEGFREYIKEWGMCKDEERARGIISNDEYTVLRVLAENKIWSDIVEKLHGEGQFRKLAGLQRCYMEARLEPKKDGKTEEETEEEGRKLTFYRKDKIAAIIDGRKMLTMFFDVEKIIHEMDSAVLLSKTGSAIGTLENVDKIEER
jgi:hypothetical protein